MIDVHYVNKKVPPYRHRGTCNMSLIDRSILRAQKRILSLRVITNDKRILFL